jgi:hypothetical protein
MTGRRLRTSAKALTVRAPAESTSATMSDHEGSAVRGAGMPGL